MPYPCLREQPTSIALFKDSDTEIDVLAKSHLRETAQSLIDILTDTHVEATGIELVDDL